MIPRRSVPGAWLGLVLILCMPISASSIDYHPLIQGTEWHYENELGQSRSTVISGEFELLGQVTVVRHEETVESDTLTDVVENFWSSDVDGNLYLHGAINLMHDFEAAYVPPIQVIDSPLAVGKTWVTEDIEWCELDGTGCRDPFDLGYEVYSEGTVSVPSGDFYSFGVGQSISWEMLRSPDGEHFDVMGHFLGSSDPTARRGATEWYSAGVGMVQQNYHTWPEYMMKLVSWSPSRVSPMTWGRVKSLYR